MSAARAWSVSQLTALIRGVIGAEPRLEDVLVEGEISNLSMPRSGHLYFRIKDGRSSLQCVCFRTNAQLIRFQPANGMVVVAHGRVDVYEQEGSYQLYVDRLDPAGLGALMLAVDQLRRRLAAEGLFDERRKRRLPLLPRRIAVVTSTTGAAVRDVCTVTGRRAPGVEVVVVPTPVQGEVAAASLIRALAQAQALPRVGVILLVRGGGSFEDLLAYQDEGLARAIAACPIPVVTGIGHETDTTIADLVADRRAPTPSAAAEMCVPDVAALHEDVVARSVRLRNAVRGAVSAKRQALDGRSRRLERASPERRIPGLRQQVDGRAARLRAALLREVAVKQRQMATATSRLLVASPGRRVALERSRLAARSDRMAAAARALVEGRAAALRTARGRLDALSPRRTIERGYSITLDADTGSLVTSAARLAPGARLRTLLAGGAALSRVEGVELGAGSHGPGQTDVRSADATGVVSSDG